MDKEIEWLLKEKYDGEKSEAFFADCKRLALGEPIGYLLGHTPFLNCHIHLDSRPLIPRTETEYWTKEAIDAINEYQETKPSLQLGASEPLKIMDMCAGSGCVGVAVAKHVTSCRVDFSELDEKHLSTIKKNVGENEIASNRVRIMQSNIFSSYKDEVYNFILANPPYIDAALHRVDDSVTDFEPHLALFGGYKGLEIIIQIIAEAKYHLEPDGQLWIEHEPEQSQAIIAIAASHGFSASPYQDQYGKERYSVLVLN